jgi:hypothetical protein
MSIFDLDIRNSDLIPNMTIFVTYGAEGWEGVWVMAIPQGNLHLVPWHLYSEWIIPGTAE